MAQHTTLPADMAMGGTVTQISLMQTSGTLFDVLHASPLLGRLLNGGDDRGGAAAVAVLSERLWRTRFGARPDVAGTSIVLDGTTCTVVGVWPDTFRAPSGARLLADVDAAVPMRVTAGWVGEHNDAAVGLLREGVALDDAIADLDVLQAHASEMASKQSGQPVTLTAIARPLGETIVGRSRRSPLLSFGFVLSVLLIACANLTNLALNRALSRLRDAAVRVALGASRGQLARQALTAHAVLGVAGGAAGMWLASLALEVFVRTAPIDIPRAEEATIDAPVLFFAILLMMVTTLLVAALPVWHIARRDPHSLLRSESAGTGRGPSAMRARITLSAVQIALAVTLLTLTGLFGASLVRVLQVDYGFNADQVLAVPVGASTRAAARRPPRRGRPGRCR